MYEYVLPMLSFAPPILLLIEMIELIVRRPPATPALEAPRLQIWLQDMLVLPVMFAAAMAFGFDRLKWPSAVIPALSIAFGFVASVDGASSLKDLTPIRRVALFVAVLSAFSICLWASSMLWYIWKRWSARRAGRVCVNSAARNGAVIAALVYAAAFLLPMGRHGPTSSSDVPGWGAYYVCFMECLVSVATRSNSSRGEFPIPYLAWIANPSFWISAAFLLEGRRWIAAAGALVAMGLATTISDPSDYALFNSLAYTVWTFSMLILTLLAAFCAIKHFRSKQTSANV